MIPQMKSRECLYSRQRVKKREVRVTWSQARARSRSRFYISQRKLRGVCYDSIAESLWRQGSSSLCAVIHTVLLDRVTGQLYSARASSIYVAQSGYPGCGAAIAREGPIARHYKVARRHHLQSRSAVARSSRPS